MADTHRAVFEARDVERAELQTLLLEVLARHGVGFTGSVRGLNWSDTYEEFLPNVDEELESVNDAREAMELSSAWECSCLDYRMSQWDIEVYLFSDRSPVQRMAVALSFPHSWFNAAQRDTSILRRWRTLMIDLSLALGRTVMVCGTEVTIAIRTANELTRMLLLALAPVGTSRTGVHSGLLRLTAENEQNCRSLRDAGFQIHNEDGLLFASRIAGSQ